MYWKTDNKGVLSIIMAAGEEGWEVYRDPRQKGERAKCYRTSDQKRFGFPTPKKHHFDCLSINFTSRTICSTTWICYMML